VKYIYISVEVLDITESQKKAVCLEEKTSLEEFGLIEHKSLE